MTLLITRGPLLVGFKDSRVSGLGFTGAHGSVWDFGF